MDIKALLGGLAVDAAAIEVEPAVGSSGRGLHALDGSMTAEAIEVI